VTASIPKALIGKKHKDFLASLFIVQRLCFEELKTMRLNADYYLEFRHLIVENVGFLLGHLIR
jgi:hypothetical protein